MRKTFVAEVEKHMAVNRDIYFLTADVGYNVLEPLQKYSDRFFNVGICESSMIDMAIGLALDGKIPFVYTITPFLLRGFESIRTYINHERIPVKLVGTGRNYGEKDDYGDVMGYSHSAQYINEFMEPLLFIEKAHPRIELWRHDPGGMASYMSYLVKSVIESGKPYYINLTR